MNIERGNVRNQFFVSSDLMSLYAATKVLSQIRPPPAGDPSSGFVCMQARIRPGKFQET